MNERIFEFVKQAGISTTDHGRGPFIDDDVSLGDLERFAELIVGECVNCLGPLSRNHSMVGAAQDTIKEHFGVE